MIDANSFVDMEITVDVVGHGVPVSCCHLVGLILQKWLWCELQASLASHFPDPLS